MKKLISVMLVLCMVLALVPAMAFAAAAPAGAIAMVGEDNYYTDLQAAIDAAAAPDAKTNRVDIVGDAEVSGLVISGNVILQLNGHKLEGKSGVLAVSAPAVTVNVGATLTIQGPGFISAHGSATNAVVLGNAGTMIIDKSAQITGVIYNTGVLTVESATVTGCVINSGTVTVNGGKFKADPTGTPLFTGKGKVTINGGEFDGTLDKANDSCPGMTVNGGAFTDSHVVKHTGTTPVAGYHSLGWNADPTKEPLSAFEWFWVGKATMEAQAKAHKTAGGNVVFLYYDVALDGVPCVWDPDNHSDLYYYDGWDSYYNGVNNKQLGPQKYTGRGLVNALSDFNIVASKVSASSPYGDPIATGVLNQNAELVKSVSAKYTGTNKNEVFVQIDITVDLKKTTPFTVPEGFRSWGNNNGSHQWVPIALDFLDLNGLSIEKGNGYVARDSWNLAFTYGKNNDTEKYTTYMWVGVDHNDLGQNASFDFADMRYGDHGLIYRCTIVVHDTDVDVPEASHPDDQENAETYPGDGKDKPATSAPAATTAPAGTGGDGPARTGDNSTVMLWATLLVASAAGVAICVVDEAKKRSRK